MKLNFAMQLLYPTGILELNLQNILKVYVYVGTNVGCSLGFSLKGMGAIIVHYAPKT